MTFPGILSDEARTTTALAALRQVGEHAVVIHLGEDIDAEVKVTIVRSQDQVTETQEAESAESDGAADEQPTQNP